jgi:hypothetical protein
MPRFWFSGPRLFRGLVRPGISFALSELTKPSRPKRGGAPLPDNREPEPPPKFAEYPLHARVITWVIYGFAIYGFLALVGCVGGAAHAGTCRVYQAGGYAVTACEDGTFTVRDRDGKVRAIWRAERWL